MEEDSSDGNAWLRGIDFSAISPRNDKIKECAYFLSLLEQETDRNQFRWLLAAFLNAAYSYFEIAALRAYAASADGDTGEPLPDAEAIEVLQRYIGVKKSKNPWFLKTFPVHPVATDLYKVRKDCTHYFPLNLMIAGPVLPDDFHIGSRIGSGRPAMRFCRDIMELVQTIERELGAC